MLGAMATARLLLVDDEDNLRSMLEAALRHSGFDVHPVANGRDAIDAVPDGRSGPHRARRDAPRPRRLRRVQAPPPDRRPHARAVPHGPRRHRGQGAGPHARRRRLPREAVQPRGAGGARSPPCCAAPASIPPPATCAAATCPWTTTPISSLKAGQEVSLSPTEFNLLRYLLVNKGRVVSKAQILDHVWDYDFGGDGGVVETYIGYLRRKLDTTEPRLHPDDPWRGVHAADAAVGGDVAPRAAAPRRRARSHWCWRSRPSPSCARRGPTSSTRSTRSSAAPTSGSARASGPADRGTSPTTRPAARRRAELALHRADLGERRADDAPGPEPPR